jgi:hypothetical protein
LLEFIKCTWDCKIFFISLPQKISGKLQLLDVVIFKEFQKEYGHTVEEEVQAGVGITKQEFAQKVTMSLCFGKLPYLQII